MSVVLVTFKDGDCDECGPVRSGPPTTEHFYVAVTTSGGYNGPTLSARAIERALIVRALEEEVPLDGIRVQRWESRVAER